MIFLNYKAFEFPTETFGGMCFCIYVLPILVDVRWLDLHVGVGFGVLIPHLRSEILLDFSFDLEVYVSMGTNFVI